MNEIIDKTIEMFICMIIGAALGACIVYSNMRDKVEQKEKVEITNYVSNIPAQFERTAANNFADTNFVTVMKCDSSVSYKVPFIRVEQNRQKNKILLIEAYTNKEYVFNGNEFMVISEQYDWVVNRTNKKILGNCNVK